MKLLDQLKRRTLSIDHWVGSRRADAQETARPSGRTGRLPIPSFDSTAPTKYLKGSSTRASRTSRASRASLASQGTSTWHSLASVSEHSAREPVIARPQTGSVSTEETDSRLSKSADKELSRPKSACTFSRPLTPSEPDRKTLHPPLTFNQLSQPIFLKPVTKEETIRHVVEEIQEIELEERHVTHIHHHVQPVHLEPESRPMMDTYRLAIGPTESTQPLSTLSKDQEPSDGGRKAESHPEGMEQLKQMIDSTLETHIRDTISDNRDRYEEHAVQPTETVHLPSLAERITVEHHYHIIQPVIVERQGV